MLFGTNGVRGRFNELTPELTLKISQAIGIYFNKRKIGVARDARLTGECLERAVLSGLSSVGCEVVKFGIISSPTAEFMVKKLGLDGLIIITASHNPPEWNALKVVDGKGIAISKERGAEIENIMDNIVMASWKEVKKIEEYKEAVKDHMSRIKELVDVEKIRKRKLKLVLDSGNGASATIAPLLFKEIGCEVLEINSELDGRFPNRASEPTKDNVEELIKRVKKEKADAGIAWDGDGDRVIFVDETGEYVIGDKVFGISVILKMNEKKGGIITTVATSKSIEEIGKRHDAKTHYTKVGAPYLSEEMSKGKGVIGGEEVGGVIWPEISLAKDGILTAVKIVEGMCEKKLSRWVEEIPKYYLKKIKVKVEEKEKKEVLEKTLNYAKKKGLETITVDGVRMNFEDGWVIVRASGTEPIVRIFAEGRTKKRAEELIEEIEKIIS